MRRKHVEIVTEIEPWGTCYVSASVTHYPKTWHEPEAFEVEVTKVRRENDWVKMPVEKITSADMTRIEGLMEEAWYDA